MKNYVQCPYFIAKARRNNVSCIECEGIIKTTTELLCFEESSDTAKYYKAFCCGEYKLCPKYQNMMMWC